MVSFLGRDRTVDTAEFAMPEVPGEGQQLQAALDTAREDLRLSIEQMEASNEELKASNEEIRSINEELQASNEELETSKEELQSLNEELNTVNNQLQAKLGELEQRTDEVTTHPVPPCNLLDGGEGPPDTKKRGLVTHVPGGPRVVDRKYTPGSVDGHAQDRADAASVAGSRAPYRRST